MSDTLAAVAEVIGMPAAQALVCVFGGGAVYVPQHPAADSPLVRLLGELQAGRLAAVYGGGTLDLPQPPIAAARAAWVKELRRDGYTIREISARVHVGERRIFQLLAE
jgi:hypothetical protein